VTAEDIRPERLSRPAAASADSAYKAHDEANFRRYLEDLKGLALAAEEVIAGGQKGSFSAGKFDFPVNAVWDLKTPSTLHFMAGIELVSDPRYAHAADLMVRALLEALAHLCWIWFGEPATNRVQVKPGMCLGDEGVGGCTAERRAVCLALGMARVFSDNIAKVDANLVPEGTSAAVQERLDRLTEIHKKLGCTGTGRTWQDVRPMLALLKKQGRIPWAHDLWVAESGVAHGLIPDQYWSSVTGVTMKGGPAEPEARKLLAQWLVKTYFNFAYCCVGILRPAETKRFREMVSGALTGWTLQWADGEK